MAPTIPAVALRAFPHCPDAFTQGLVVAEGSLTRAHSLTLYESTGLYGGSSVRQCDLVTGAVQQLRPLPPTQFGEGLARVGAYLYQLTWRERLLHVIPLADWSAAYTVPYPPTWPAEGWGLAYDQHQLLLTDGSATLYFAEAAAPGRMLRHVLVTDDGRPVRGLNALAVVRGYVYANVFPTSQLAIIEPRTGRVAAWLELAPLYPFPLEEAQQSGYVANGIAYDPVTHRLFVTGKCWPVLYELALPEW